MSRNACENRRNGNDFHSGHRKQNSNFLFPIKLIYWDLPNRQIPIFHLITYKAPRQTGIFAYVILLIFL